MKLGKQSWLKALFKGLMEASIWVVWALLVVLAALFVLIGVFEHFGVLDEQSPDWLMAVGSIGAVLAAIFIASHQSREMANVRRQKEAVVEATLNSLAKRASDVLEEIVGNFEFYRRGNHISQRELIVQAEQHLLVLQGISLADLPRPELVEPLLIIRGGLEQSIFHARALSVTGDRVPLRTMIQLKSHNRTVREAVARLV